MLTYVVLDSTESSVEYDDQRNLGEDNRSQFVVMDTATPTATSSSSSTPRIWDLAAEKELRFQVDWEGGGATLTVVSGSCECFGTELAPRGEYHFTPGAKCAVFTWRGCSLQLRGAASHAYVAGDTPMPAYAVLHSKLEALRLRARDADAAISGAMVGRPTPFDEPQGGSARGPTIFLCGPVDCGKSTITRILLAYATRLGHMPIFVDLDVGQGSITVPGVVAAVGVEKPPHPSEGLSGSGCSTPPIAYYYGNLSSEKNPVLYKQCVTNLARAVDEKFKADPIVRHSGIIVNTCGWIDDEGEAILFQDFDTFRPDIIAVIEDERLFHDISVRYPPQSSTVSVMKIPKSGGVVSRNTTERRKARGNRIKEYYYGVNGDLCPHSTILNFSDVTLFRIGGGPAAPPSALPIGQAPSQDPVRLVEVTPTSELVHSLLGVVMCTDPSALLTSNVAGFLYVNDIDFERRTITVLAPCPGDLPSRFLVVGTLKWDD
ncbi:pre-mRNA cleavage complex subunit [Pelomyxa schiedti]|nr:pre-mRNA cleavage complex subunit [Pelomyxa schiedti]